jgi:peptide deformylase
MSKQLPITTYGMDILRQQTEPVKKITNGIIELVDNMFYTMRNADGIGLAAPQVNINKKIAVIDISLIGEYKHIKPIILINPEVVDTYNDVTLEEGCLSIPDVRAPVSRGDKIYLKYMDLNLNELEIEVDGYFARVIQHEIDHLNGILFIDKVNKDDLKKFKSQLRKIQKRKAETDYPLYESNF